MSRRQEHTTMKSFVKWAATIASVAVGGLFAWNAVQAGRRRLRSGLARAEAVADRTRAALEETESTLHSVRTSI
jgi:hypothetical protein